MSLTSRLLFGVGLALVLLACSVDAHGWMSYPKPRGQYTSPPKPSYLEYAPATTNPSDPAIVCRNDPVMPKESWLELRAGQAQQITLEFNALHVGDCFVYLSYDGDKPVNEMKWFKIWEQHECKNSNQYDITIPSYLPSGDHVVFRWEWYALHVYPTIEYYSQCVDAKMTGSISALSAAAASALPTPQVAMPGHLPAFAGDYADRTNNYWWPWDNQPMFFTGPSVATPNGQSTSGSATLAPVATKAPTQAPVATKAPTQAPAATKAPTQAPAATKAPTQAPAATKAPTQAPAATKAPTQAATSAPVATSPPAHATTKPDPTKPPVNQPPAQSVKLNVLRDSSSWWFAASVSGHRSNEVTKVEIKDSGSITTFQKMDISWGDVYVFLPGSNGPITFPVTVKASLASGSSLSFVVNGLPATIIDSGAVFP